MIRTKSFLHDRIHTLVQFQRLRKITLRFVNVGDVVEDARDAWALRPDTFFEHLDRTPVQVQGARVVFSLFLSDQSQILERHREFRTVGGLLFPNLERALQQRLSAIVLLAGVVKRAQVVERRRQRKAVSS